LLGIWISGSIRELGDWIAAGIDTGFDSSTGFAEVATNWDMVDERDFGYPSGELQVKLLYSGFSLVVILQGVAGTMSRCFPFPPPGYEATPRREQQHKDLLRKGKHKEKKHRKEKGRGQGGRKEKDRDHKKDKHSKKHKREERRGRRNNKDRDKDKTESLGQNTQKNYKHVNRKPEERGRNEAVKPTEELINPNF